MRCFEYRFPFEPSDFARFRKRIGESGFEKIFEYSVKAHETDTGAAPHAKAERHLSDTAVQENNTTFPADAKLCRKVIDGCSRIADELGITLRRSCRRESRQLLRGSCNAKHPRRMKRAKKARKRLKTIANAQIRGLQRKMNPAQETAHRGRLGLYIRAANQQRHGRDKVYSLHKPFTRCISIEPKVRGKARKQYEFGNKAGIIVTGNKGRKIITAVKTFVDNPYDGRTVEPLLEQMGRGGQGLPKEIIYDRGGKGRKEIRGVKILTPDKPKKTDTDHMKREKRKRGYKSTRSCPARHGI